MSKERILLIILIVAAFAVHGFFGSRAIRAQSPTYDEPVHLAAGYAYLATGDYRLNSFDHPPFAEMWAALPLLAMNPMVHVGHPYWQQVTRYQYPFADLFIYHNRVDADKMIAAGRWMIMLLSFALGALILLWATQLYGLRAGVVALWLWACFPSFIAHGTFITTDMAMVLFFTLTMYALWRWERARDAAKKFPWLASAGFAGAIGMLFASKYSAIAVLPVIAGVLCWRVYEKKGTVADIVKLAMIAATGIFVVLVIVYKGSPLDVYYWVGLKKVIAGVTGGRASFLMGEYSTQGWAKYFPIVFLLKTPLSLLAFIAVAACTRSQWNRTAILFLLLPAAFYFCLSCCSKVQIGHRHILAVYPFLMIWVSGLVPVVARWKPSAIAGGVLLVWYACIPAFASPWQVSFLNELTGRRDYGWRYLTDSNIDWGQGLKALSSYLKERKVSGIYLNYFGTANPEYYGISYVPFGFVDNISYPATRDERRGTAVDFSAQPATLLAISATNLQSTYYADKHVLDFIKELTPVAVIARSIIVYDLTGKTAVLEKLNELMYGKKSHETR